MFVFNPPVKMARTQRNTIVRGDAADTSFASTVDGDSMSTSLGAVDPNGAALLPALCGVGSTISWIVRKDGRVSITDHSMLSAVPSLQRSKVDIAARIEHVPEFQPDEGDAVFAAEFATQRSVVFCSRRGTVLSADKLVEVFFQDTENRLDVTGFDCSSTPARCLVAVGTADGMVLIGGCALQQSTASSDRATAVQTFRIPDSLAAGSKKTPAGGQQEQPQAATSSFIWGLWSKGWGVQKDTSVDKDHFSTGVPFVRFSLTDKKRLFAATSSGHFLLLALRDEGGGGAPGSKPVSLMWSLTPRDMLCIRRGQTTPRASVVAATDSSHGTVAILLAVQSATGAATPVLVVVDAATGDVRSMVQIAHQSLFRRGPGDQPDDHRRLPGPGAANVFLDTTLHAQMVVVVGRNALIRANTSVGVRSPCAAEDVKTYDFANDAVCAGAMLPNRRVVLLLPRRPLLVEVGGGASATAVLDKETVSLEQKLANIRQGFRADSRHSIDEACLHEVEAILLYASGNEANWARASRDTEDVNLLTHVTQSVTSRRQRLEDLLFGPGRLGGGVLKSDIASHLSDGCVVQLVSTVDQMLALEAIRMLQNFMPRQQQPGEAATTGNMRARLPATATAPADGADKAAIDISDAEGRTIQAILGDAIRFVVAELRRTADTPLDPNMSAAELFYAKPGNVLLFLRVLNSHILSLFASTEEAAEADRFSHIVAVGIVFHVVAQKLMLFWDDADAAVSKVRKVLWPSSAAGDSAASLAGAEHADTIVAQQSLILSDALVVMVAASASSSQGALAYAQQPSSSLHNTPRAQNHVLEALVKLLSMQFRHDPCGTPGDRMTFASPALRRTLFRPPFLARPTGYPHGAPQATPGPISRLALEAVQTLALEFNLFDITFDCVLADYHTEPTAPALKGLFDELQATAVRQPRAERGLMRFAVRQLAAQRREQDLAIVYANAPAEVAVSVRELLGREFPHMLARLEPRCVTALLREGRVGPTEAGQVVPYLAYGSTVLEHFAGCVALAKLAHAAYSPDYPKHTTMASSSSQLLDPAAQQHERLARLQRGHSAVADRLLTPHELVLALLQPTVDPASPGGAPTVKLAGFMDAVQLAEHEGGAKRGQLVTEVLDRAYQRDAAQLARIAHDNPSEADTASKLANTAVGHVLQASALLRHRADMEQACSDVRMPAAITRLLWDWLDAFPPAA